MRNIIAQRISLMFFSSICKSASNYLNFKFKIIVTFSLINNNSLALYIIESVTSIYRKNLILHWLNSNFYYERQ